MDQLPKRRGRKPRAEVVKLYSHLAEMIESGDWKTGWDKVDDICEFLFGSRTAKGNDKTRAAVAGARRLIKQEYDKLFYHTENHGYIILMNTDQHREVIKRQAAISDGFRFAAQETYRVGSLTLPELKTLRREVALLSDGAR